MTLSPIAAVAGLAGESFPLADDETAELLELRNECWKIRTSPTLYFPQTAEFPRSFAAAYERVGGSHDERIRPRQAPHFVWLPDVGQASYR